MDMYEPRHLLKFTGDPELELHYSYLVYNYRNKNSKAERHECDACKTVLLMQEQPRLKPRQRMTKTIQKLMVKKSKKIPLSRIENYKLNKFMDSSQQMVVKCSQCSYINKKPTVGRRDLIRFRSKLLSAVDKAIKEMPEEAGTANRKDDGKERMETGSEKLELDGNDNIAEKEPVTGSKKRKKKKKKKNKNKDFISTIIQQKASEKKAKKKKESISTPVSLQNFVLSESNDTPTSSHSKTNVDVNIFYKAISSDTSWCKQTPVCTEPKNETKQPSTTKSSSSKKNKKKSKSDKELRKSLFFESPTPNSNHKPSRKQTPPTDVKNSTNSKQIFESTPSSRKNKKRVIQKELRKYLTDVPQTQEKSSSLTDFLISL